MLRIEIAEPAEVGRRRDDWNRLVEKMARPSIFCTWEWIYSWWQYLGQEDEPLFIFFYRNDAMIGILPLALRRLRLEDTLIPCRVLTFCGSLDLHSDHLDLIAAPENADECLERFVAFLNSDYRSWDIVHLSHVADDSRILAWARQQRGAVDIQSVSAAACIPLGQTYADFEKTLRGDKRRDLNRLKRVLYDNHGVTYRTYRPETDPDGVRILFDLHARRSQRKGIRSSFEGERLIRFHEAIVKLLYALGWVRLRFLYAGDHAIAANYCFEYQGRFFGYQQGLDPDWEQRSVGNVLLLELIREACDAGMVEFDLLRGARGYKGHWTSFSRDLSNVDIHNYTLRARLIRWTKRVRTHAVALLRSLLQRGTGA